MKSPVARNVPSIATGRDEIVPISAVDGVVTRAALKDIIIVAAIEEIILFVAVQRVLTEPAVQRVLLVVAVQRVGAAFALDMVSPGVAEEQIVLCTAVQYRHRLSRHTTCPHRPRPRSCRCHLLRTGYHSPHLA